MKERERVSAELRELLERSRAGAASTLFVVGDAGIGKTTVLEDARAAAAGAFRIASARGDPMETSLPFGYMAQAIDALGGSDVLDVTAPAAAADVRAARFFRVLRWIQGAVTRPTLLLLDDVHWSDPDSIALLSFLCRRVTDLPLAVIVSLRSWPAMAHDAAMALAHAGLAAIERLEPLSDAAAAALIGELVGRHIDGEALRRAVASCAGNPLLLEQVAMAIERGEDPPRPDELGTGAIPTDLLLARFASLPEAAVRYAQAASAFGPGFRPELVAEVSRLREPDADEALEALWDSGLLKDAGGGRVEFTHALFAQALYQDMAPPARHRLHARAFAALADRGQDAEAAEHAMSSGGGSRREIELLERVGRAAMAAGALEVASRQLEAAAAMAGDRAGAELLIALGEVQFGMAHVLDAAATYERLLAYPDLTPALRVRALRTRGRALHLLGDADAASQSWEDVLRVSGDLDPRVGVEALLDLALASMFNFGPAPALSFAARARELAVTVDDDTRHLVDGAWGMIANQAGDPAGAPAAAAAARAAHTGTESLVSWDPLMTHAFAATWSERFADADRAIETALAGAERSAAVAKIGALIDVQICLLWRRGRLADAWAACERAAALADMTPLARAFLAMARGLVALDAGRPDVLDESIRGLGPAAGAVWAIRVALGHLRGLRHLRDGEVELACRAYDDVDRAVRDAGVGNPGWPVPWARHAITAFLACGRGADASRLIEWLEGAAARETYRWPAIAAAAGRGLRAGHAGDVDGAEAHFRRALELGRDTEMPLENAETLLAYGGVLRRGGRMAAARATLAEALHTAEACEAGRLVDAAAGELRVAGGRRRRRRDPDRLTAQETRVAELAAEGMTNREIAARLQLSVSTIETHLEHVYAKLGIGSRRELMRRWGRRS